MTALSVRPEGPLDGPSIEHLLDRSFGIDRRRKISYRYRFGVAPVEGLCLVAEDGPAGMVGAIRYWPLVLGQHAALLLGPLAIDPQRRGQGIGRLLMSRSMMLAAAQGWPHVFLVGDPNYYRQFGFEVVVPTLVMPGENPARLMGRSLDGMPLPTEGVLLPWLPHQDPAGQMVKPSQQRDAGQVEALVAGHAVRHPADLGGEGCSILCPGDRHAERPHPGVDGEQDVAALRQPPQGLVFQPQEQPVPDLPFGVEHPLRAIAR
jgi:predicted N-acetyltransferase YhbS